MKQNNIETNKDIDFVIRFLEFKKGRTQDVIKSLNVVINHLVELIPTVEWEKTRVESKENVLVHLKKIDNPEPLPTWLLPSIIQLSNLLVSTIRDL